MTHPAAPLVVFLVVVITVVLAVLYQDRKYRIPLLDWEYTIKFYHPPLIGVFLLLCLSPTAGAIRGIDLWEGGFAGDGKVFPYKTMVQFETLAFVCISLDMTGVLAYIALKAIQAAGSSGRRLFLYFYFLSSAFTICTSNDIVILTLTPIIYYCTKVAGISPYPMLFGEFFTANICSMVLVIGNPVNLIVANANNLSFAAYSNWMAAPAIVGSCTCCFVLYIFFRKDIDVTFNPPQLDPESVLKDMRGVWFHGAVLFLTRLLLGVADVIHAEGWVITTVAAFVSLCYNLYFWPWDHPTQAKVGTESVEMIEIVSSRDNTPIKAPSSAEFQSPKSVADNPEQVMLWTAPNEKPKSSAAPMNVPESGAEEVSTEFPTTKASIFNCPWAVMPFVYGMFTLVSALKNSGWIDALAETILRVIPQDEGESTHAIAVATFLMTTISFVLCTLIDNQPASILLTQVLVSPIFDQLPKAVRTAGMLGVLEGANVGGNWSLMGALAGIMWATLLRNKGISIGYVQFMKVGLRVMPLVTFMIALIIFAECASST